MSDERPRGVEAVVEDVAGVDFKFPRTIWATVRRPVAVARAGMAGDRSRYASPLRVFMVLFGVQIALMGFFQLQEAQAPSVTMPPDVLAAFEAGLKPGVSLADADEDFVRWYNIFMLPAALIASLPFIGLFKAFNPQLKWLEHAVIYLVSVNASYIVGLAASPLYFGGQALGLLSGLISLVAWIAYMFPLIRAFLAQSSAGAALKTSLAVVLVPPTLVLMVLLLFVAIETAMTISVGVGPFAGPLMSR